VEEAEIQSIKAIKIRTKSAKIAQNGGLRRVLHFRIDGFGW
jgi:hypothetical protein